MTLERYIWTIVAILFVVLTVELTGVVEAKVAYEQNVAAHQANTIRYERSRDRLERHFDAIRERTAAPVEYTDFAGLIGETTELRSEEEEPEASASDAEEREPEAPDEPAAEAEAPSGGAVEEPEPVELPEESEAVPPSEPEPVETEPEPHVRIEGSDERGPDGSSTDASDEDKEAESPVPETTEEDAFSAYESAVEEEIHRLTNIERAEQDLEPLSYDGALADIAASHSEDMAERDYFDHETPEGCDLGCRFEEAGYEASAWAENIAWRMQTTLPNPEDIAEHFMESWMDSSGHRENILNEDLTHEGVGVVRIDNTVYVTADFSIPK